MNIFVNALLTILFLFIIRKKSNDITRKIYNQAHFRSQGI
jgi:hypothetical protein